MSKYKIFISHKEQDEHRATVVRKQLSKFSGLIEAFISGDHLVPGEDWHQQLLRELRESDLLLLLYTEPTRKWDWCLYEAGLFTSLEDGEDQPIVCFYSADGEPPGPLVAKQGVPATKRDMAQFIQRLITTTEITKRDEPLNAGLDDEEIATAAERICEQFTSQLMPYYACYRLHLKLPADSDFADGIPSDATVQATERTLAIFGRGGGDYAWHELVAPHLGEDGYSPARWLAELDAAFARACRRELFPPTNHTFRGHNGARIFRPELYRIDREGDEPVAAVIILTEEVAPAKVGGPVFNLLRVAERYKTEVFEPYADETAAGEAHYIESVRDAMDGIREEAKWLGTFDPRVIEANFEEGDAREELFKLSGRWDDEAAGFEAAIEAAQVEAVQHSLTALSKVNDRYRAITADRYAELVATNVAS